MEALFPLDSKTNIIMRDSSKTQEKTSHKISKKSKVVRFELPYPHRNSLLFILLPPNIPTKNVNHIF